jgi:amino acid adenylation domain-containing protein
MTTIEFLAYLRDQDIQVWADGDRLRVNAPAGRLTPQLRNDLAVRKGDILEFLRSVAANVPSMRPVSRDGDLPLSLGQERIWFLNQLEPDSPAYTISSAWRLTGPLNAAVLVESFNEVIRRHESLRTAFPVVDGRPVQVIASHLELSLSVTDLRHLHQARRGQEASRLAEEVVRQPFDLERGPLLRVALLRLDEEEHILVLVVHHIISDAWSIGVLFQELSAIYVALSAARTPGLPALPLQYVDFAVWQRQWLQGRVRREHLAYWRRQLGGRLPVLELPADHPRPAIQSNRGARKSANLPSPLSDALKELSAREGTTLFMTLLAAFKVLLHRYSGQADMIVGSPVSGRNLTEVEGLIGFFLNTLILRTDLSDDPTFRELLHRVRETVLAAFAHQVIPFEELLRELHPERSTSHAPLFQVLFVLHDPTPGHLVLPGVDVSRLPVQRGTTQFELSLIVRDRQQGLSTTLSYNTDLFEAPTIARMLGHYQALLESSVADPDQRVSQLPLLTKPERQQLLVDWNRTGTRFPRQRCFHELFEEQVARAPDRIAVTCSGASLTYQQLNARANRLANLLLQKGVGPDVVVAVLDQRGIDLMVGFLAILKAGGAYLPLDPRHPPQRHFQILSQSQAALILTQSPFLPALSQATETLDSGARPGILLLADLAQHPAEADDLPLRCTPDDLAYVIYTSGSTGLPKGAMVEHKGMLNHLFAKITDLELTGHDLVAQNASQTFDISVWQFLAALLVGGQVAILPDEVAYDPQALLQQVASQRISILETVPSVLRLLLDDVVVPGAAHLDLSALRWLIPTGEALPPNLARQWLTCFPDIPLLNAYGPTECSDDVTHYPIFKPPAPDVVHMPIGRPIANMRMYVLDEHLQPVPIGVSGELCVAGIGVGRGYLNDPEHTAEVFLNDPFSSNPTARLYRTGDLVRYLPDGNIEFLGRLDYQVKIRGFRIELGEIEAVLADHPNVREVILTVNQATDSDEQLVAYVVPETGQEPSAAELRAFLRDKLPDYMIPALWVILEAFPLTPNGKVDRKALPEPNWTNHELASASAAPRSAVEEVLASIFGEVLNLDQVGVHDNFFDLGGHSLLATRVISRVRDALHADVALFTLFEAPTIAALSDAIIHREEKSGHTERIAQLRIKLRTMPTDKVKKILDEKRPRKEPA